MFFWPLTSIFFVSAVYDQIFNQNNTFSLGNNWQISGTNKTHLFYFNSSGNRSILELERVLTRINETRTFKVVNELAINSRRQIDGIKREINNLIANQTSIFNDLERRFHLLSNLTDILIRKNNSTQSSLIENMNDNNSNHTKIIKSRSKKL